MYITDKDVYEYGQYLYHSSRYNDQTELLDCLEGVVGPTDDGISAELRHAASQILLGFENAQSEDHSRMSFSVENDPEVPKEEWGLWDEGRMQWVRTGFGTEREADLVRAEMEKQMDEDDETNLQVLGVKREERHPS